MKAPITQAQAWAVIAESAGWNEKELPVLPEAFEANYFESHATVYTADQLSTYGLQCAAQARELALSKLTDAEIFSIQYELQCSKDGFSPIPFARAVLEKAGK